ncbi:MAG: hypothetical protein P8177_07910, partial [Gemmatimonadota bacterium]
SPLILSLPPWSCRSRASSPTGSADDEECADRFAFDLVPVDGSTYRLSARYTNAEVSATLEAADGRLTWPESPGAGTFLEAALDPATFPVCAGGGDDPALLCSELPTLSLDTLVEAELSEADSLERGRYYDLYRLEPVGGATATVTLGSEAVDPYLYVYDAAGTLVAENDDADLSTLDAALTLPFDAACYRIEVTSFDAGALGSYTVRVE